MVDLLERIRGSGAYPLPPTSSESEARSRFHDFFMQLVGGTNSFDWLARVDDTTIRGRGSNLKARIYTPIGTGPFPVMIHFHGGGWSRGDLDIWDGFCAQIAIKSLSLVVSVDYRLSPEHRFPDALNDAYDSIVWAAQNAHSLDGDAERLGVIGDSAGGNLAAAASLMARDRQGFPKLSLQILIYPSLAYTFNTRSYLANSDSFFLTRERSIANWNRYLRSPLDARNPYACPSEAESLKGLPRAMVVTAEYDPLRDEGESYARRLASDGVKVSYKCYPGMIHPFVLLAPFIDEGRKAIDDIANEIREAFVLKE